MPEIAVYIPQLKDTLLLKKLTTTGKPSASCDLGGRGRVLPWCWWQLNGQGGVAEGTGLGGLWHFLTVRLQ